MLPDGEIETEAKEKKNLSDFIISEKRKCKLVSAVFFFLLSVRILLHLPHCPNATSFNEPRNFTMHNLVKKNAAENLITEIVKSKPISVSICIKVKKIKRRNENSVKYLVHKNDST